MKIAILTGGGDAPGLNPVIRSVVKVAKENKIEGITNLTPSYNKLIISFDLSITNFKKITKIFETLKVTNNNQEDSKKNKNSFVL